MVKPDRPQMTIWRRAACKATRASTFPRLHTHSHTHTNVLYLLLFDNKNIFVNAPQCYTYIALLFIITTARRAQSTGWPKGSRFPTWPNHLLPPRGSSSLSSHSLPGFMVVRTWSWPLFYSNADVKSKTKVLETVPYQHIALHHVLLNSAQDQINFCSQNK